MILQVLVSVLMIWLLSRWMLDALKFRASQQSESPPRRVVSFARLLIIVLRYFSMTYVVTEWALGRSSVLLFGGRLLLEIGLFLWSLLFWKRFGEIPEHLFPGKAQSWQPAKSLIAMPGYMIVSGGLLLELAGYGQLARYWYVSWGRTLVVLLWSLLIFGGLREWEQRVKDRAPSGPDESGTTAYQLRWLLVRHAWLVWLTLVVVGLLFAWGAKPRIVFIGGWNMFTYAVPIGGLNMSLLRLTYAVLILVLTRVATLFWRRALQDKLLRHSGLGKGFQNSLSTISVYLLWIVGSLWALNIIGVSAASLTVAFGALGVGLGFGLRDIFNNFVSGLVLLFERPIEVGDVIEVDGMWGRVAKIHIRSTVVHTFEHSTIIIPNSEIVSQRLTNWTFHDPRIRRTITIGVAYGSDVDLVKQTLYAIAERHPRVVDDPAPMVLFADFADSAMIFKLRVWTLLDYSVTTETDIRCDIDRIFREKHIKIPFSQHDVHIVSPTENSQPEEQEQD